MLVRFGLIISLVAFAVYWCHIRIRPEDAVAYGDLLKERSELRTGIEQQPAHQERRGVQKDIWSQDETRHFQMNSDFSKLTLNKGNAVEQLQGIRGQIENEFTLSADEGIYRFPSHQFVGEKNCKVLQNENQIDGTRIHLDLSREIVTYDHPKGHLASGPLDFSANQLIWYKKEGKLHLIDCVAIEQPDQFSLVADQGTVTLVASQPTLVVLEGNVRLISSRIQDKESHAIADTLTYNPIEKTFLFAAVKKVYFWQEGMSLSAPEILIRQNQTVEGRGDVHFAFDLDEQNYIDELFKQYL